MCRDTQDQAPLSANEVLGPHLDRVRARVGPQPAVLIVDRFRGHTTEVFIAACEAKGVRVVFVPPARWHARRRFC